MSPLPAPSVVVDGEPVTFEGPPPSHPKQLYQLIDQALLGGGRLIKSFLVDGTNAQETPSCLDKSGYHSVDVTSIDWENACKNAIKQAWPAAKKACEELMSYGSAMLAIPLGNSIKEINSVAERMAAVVSPLETAHQFSNQFSPSWTKPVNELLELCNEACEQFTNALKTQDVGLAAESLVIMLPQSLKAFMELPSTPWNT